MVEAMKWMLCCLFLFLFFVIFKGRGEQHKLANIPGLFTVYRNVSCRLVPPRVVSSLPSESSDMSGLSTTRSTHGTILSIFAQPLSSPLRLGTPTTSRLPNTMRAQIPHAAPA